MTPYTIETNNRAVAITNDDEVVARLNGLDPVLRETVRHLKRGGRRYGMASRPSRHDRLVMQSKPDIVSGKRQVVLASLLVARSAS